MTALQRMAPSKKETGKDSAAGLDSSEAHGQAKLSLGVGHCQGWGGG